MTDPSGEAPSQPFVRPARLIDAAAFAGVQHRSWTATSAALGIPEPPDLAHMELAWQRAITAPPSDRHHSWVAVERTAQSERVRGIAAIAPASDPDLGKSQCVELLVLAVDPTSRGRGHGSRLLSAAMQSATDAGEHEAVAWVASADDVLRRFLEQSGWAADGAFRTLSQGSDESSHDSPALRQVRLATSLSPTATSTTSERGTMAT
jgi:GNAT superfamily N-acetyltransferase